MRDVPILEVRNVTKRFPGVVALNRVNLTVRPNEIHALLGENGAGKSTLMKIISGAYQKDEGEILLDGRPVQISKPSDSMNLGIAIIYQDLNLIPDLSVAENIFFGRLPHKGFLRAVDFNMIKHASQELLTRVNARIDPMARVGDLSVADRQLVAIARALSFKPRVLIMDEPTASLSAQEVQTLFDVMRDLKTQNVGLIFISHHLEEIFEIADRVTVLRDGQYVDSKPIDELDKETIVHMMVGRRMETLYPRVHSPQPDSDVVLRVEGLSQGNTLHDISFGLRRGEILGISGLVGSGRSELMHSIFGGRPIDSGEIWLEGRKVQFHSPSEAVAYGIALVPEDRGDEGLHLEMSVRENICLPHLRRFYQNFRISRKAEEKTSKSLISRLNVKTTGSEQLVGFLSGGNQQKVAIAKWLVSEPKVLILDEPTKGVDVGAKSEIHRIMSELASRGVGIIMVSPELPEILGMSDRILVMSNGRIAAEFSRAEATPDKIMMAATSGGAA
ncbi:MAG: sugar ABC transporter ATP-binding protein [Firmicutes bacterium]|jgi:ABC-type sugar transport system ATPase subunit|nr:sugar ABC transporter ATP-binding protein [Bacillota bacterium]